MPSLNRLLATLDAYGYHRVCHQIHCHLAKGAQRPAPRRTVADPAFHRSNGRTAPPDQRLSKTTQIVFGTDVDGWKPGSHTVVGEAATGYPIRKLSQLKPGEYTVQALLNRYETFHLPMDAW